ncbi:hypothetical protein CKY51_05725 [Xanthomonas maliensis]|nr:hypothetical protein CKY51_05725 [Xanthomonas maliensis]
MERLTIIHSSDTPSTFEISSRLYDVTVIDVADGHAAVSEAGRKFFGIGGDSVSSDGKVNHRYPYKTRDKVIAALNSKIFDLPAGAGLAATVTDKAFLYPEANSRESSKSYLIAGDRVTVLEASTGWCKIRFRSKNTSIIRWLECDRLDAAADALHGTRSPVAH